MTKISMKSFLHFMFLMCDLNFAFAASAINSDVYARKDQNPSETFVEYVKDHEISEKQARDNIRSMRANDYLTPAYCSKCSAEHKRYCNSVNLLKDHCCCNQSHNKEQLYFIPHTCFINEDRCYPSLGSCLTVTEIRNCCCDAHLKRYWKSVLSEASASRSSKQLAMLLAVLVAVSSY